MKTVRSKLRAGALGLTLAAGAAALPAYAAAATDQARQGSKQSNIGALGGLAIGAAAGGPVGALVGMTAGVVLGDRYHRQQQASAALAEDLGRSEAERARLAHSVSALDTSLSQTQAHDAQLGQALQQTNELGLDVGFRTDDDAIAVQTMPPLLKLGALAAAMPQAVVRIAGYADPRGSDSYNDALSMRRAQGVAAVLTTAGVPAERIVIEAHGKSESASAQGDLDAYAFDRRVTVRLELPAPDPVARRD